MLHQLLNSINFIYTNEEDIFYKKYILKLKLVCMLIEKYFFYSLGCLQLEFI